MITHHDGLFHLKGEGFSYLFFVNSTGQLEHLHFGGEVSPADAQALRCKPGLSWGSSILYQNSDVSLDVLPLEWSGSGRGDYRESPVSLDNATTDFRFQEYRIFERIAPMESSLPQAKGGCETLEITMVQTDGLTLLLYFTLIDGVLTRRTVLKNMTDREIRLHKLMSFCVDLPGSFEMTTFDGAWIAEMRPHKVSVGPGRIVHDSTTGASSNRHQPGFLLSHPDAGEDHGQVYGFNLVYSGNHYASAQKSFQGLTRVMQGINPDNFEKTLAPGDSMETPEAVLCWSDQGFNGLSAKLHDFVNRHIVPEYWQYRHRPVLFNSWEGCMFNFNHRRLVDLAKRGKKLGCELFVLDDGWFGQRNHDKAGLGDYNVNKKKLPKGISGLSAAIRKMGLGFGLWFEPEAVNPDSDLYRAHPDWALTDEHPALCGRNELLLDLTKQCVRDYIVENVSRILDEARISYVKWDMNRHSVALGAKAHDYILGLYEVLDRIFGPRPHILLESCSSGGNRFDLGILCYSPQVWCSDNTDPIERLTIQQSLSYLYPQSTFGSHVSAAPHAQTLRTTPLSTRGNVSFFGILGYELDLKHLLPVEEKEIQAQIQFYKDHRKTFQFGRFRRLSADQAQVWQVSDETTHIAGLYHKLISAAPGYQQLRLLGLDKDKHYHVKSRPQTLRIGPFGGLLKHVAPVNLNPNGMVIRTADRRVTMPDGGEDLTASGGALLSGVMLHPRFAGTGYDPNIRCQGDFSSAIYIIQEVQADEEHT